MICSTHTHTLIRIPVERKKEYSEREGEKGDEIQLWGARDKGPIVAVDFFHFVLKMLSLIL